MKLDKYSNLREQICLTITLELVVSKKIHSLEKQNPIKFRLLCTFFIHFQITQIVNLQTHKILFKMYARI